MPASSIWTSAVVIELRTSVIVELAVESDVRVEVVVVVIVVAGAIWSADIVARHVSARLAPSASV